MERVSRPLELILARNLLASLSTPAFLIDEAGTIAFYNDAAGALLGRRFEESGPLPAAEWTSTFGPFDAGGRPLAYDEIGLTRSLMRGRPAHDRLCVRSVDGTEHAIQTSGLPIVGAGGYRGAIVVFWPADEEDA